MSAVDWLGLVAGCLTTISFLPQVLLTWRTKKAEGVSLGMYAFFTVGVALWLVYGIMLGAWPIIIANFVTLILALFVVVMKLRFG